MKYGFIGFGNLSNAIYQGLKKENGVDFFYFSRTQKSVEIPFIEKISKLVECSDVIWLGVKPQDLREILQQMQSLDLSGKIIVSPVAGKSIDFIESYLGKKTPIVRIMPNLAIAYKKSVTAFVTNQPDNAQTTAIFDKLSKLGKAVVLTESGFDLFTAVFGSGPAFILSFVQIFKDKMHEFDLPSQLLDELLLELTRGTVSYFAENQQNNTIEQLIKNITSKGGTTEAGLTYYRENQIGKRFEGVLEAARQRSIEMNQN